ncbi:MAG: 4-hydroxybenzoate solanesyltransferase [Pseudanabaenaceae cyanobacterium SKYGB_i_bin29]|nr:4-hydroxybenzoate solanesyltransferase [Pseudanabaenaceae cyanobacterium SKYG29]MDW8420338.1 4-hydroxybenzoate solanesyltransferase [Pseudanabaenaceae cyanobacterium SKYGB_i_bin29]
MTTLPLSLRIIYLLRWHKPAGRLILMLPALWSLVVACYQQQILPPLDLTVVIVAGSLATSAMGCVINDLWDRDIDREVERTKNRPLASKSLSITVGLVVLAVAAVCALVLATYLQPLSFALCLLAVPVIVIYPLCKRFFAVPQLVLSLAWGFAVLIPWTAVTGGLDGNCWLLWAATLAWTMGFDTVYALSDREDDRRLGINSSALFFGEHTPEAVGGFYLVTAVCLAALGVNMHLSAPYFYGVGLATIGWLTHWWRLRRESEPSLYPALFNQNVSIGFVVLGGMVLATLT